MQPFLRRLLPLTFVLALAVGQSARAACVEFLDTDAVIAGNRVVLDVYDADDSSTHTWQSDHYDGISDLTEDGGVVAYVFTEDGWFYLKAVVYDPGDRKFHSWRSRLSGSISDITVSCGVVAYVDDYWSCAQAIAYDPGDRKWHDWRSPTFADFDVFTNTDGIVAFDQTAGRTAMAAAYDLGDSEWRALQLGPSLSGNVTDLFNETGVVSILAGTNVTAAAYDASDNEWRTWRDLTRIDTDPDSDGGAIAFAGSGIVYSLTYDAHEQEWRRWVYNTRSTVDDVSVSGGFVYWTINDIDYSHFVARKPKAAFTVFKSSREDSMLYHFGDTSFGDIDTWRWDFGDGSTSSDRSPVHTFKKIGDHTVTLKVTGPGGSHSVSRDIFLTSPTYTLNYAAGANGTISGAKQQKVQYGASGAPVTAAAATGHHFLNWSDGSIANPRLDAGVTANLSVTANFEINQYTVVFETDGTAGASLTGTIAQIVDYGASCTSVKAVAPASRRFVNWKKDGFVYSTANPLTVKAVSASMILVATFAPTTASESWQCYR